MTREEVKVAIEKATEAVREFKKDKNVKQATQKPDSAMYKMMRLLDEIQDGELTESVKELIKESYEVGLAGEPCPTCGGSGRI